MEEGIDIYLSNFSSVIFPKPSHYPSHSSVYAFERDWSRVNGIVIGTRLQTPCTFFELKFPINCSQEEQEPLSANLCTHMRAPDLNHQEKENPSLSPASGQVGFSQITLINNSAAHRWSNNFRENPSTKKVPLPRPNWKNIPTRGICGWYRIARWHFHPRQCKQRYLVKIRIQPQYSSSGLPYLSKQFTRSLTLLAFCLTQ